VHLIIFSCFLLNQSRKHLKNAKEKINQTYGEILGQKK
jgi:hypothetical protein